METRWRTDTSLRGKSSSQLPADSGASELIIAEIQVLNEKIGWQRALTWGQGLYPMVSPTCAWRVNDETSQRLREHELEPRA